jgi:hypothetical protein
MKEMRKSGESEVRVWKWQRESSWRFHKGFIPRIDRHRVSSRVCLATYTESPDQECKTPVHHTLTR